MKRYVRPNSLCRSLSRLRIWAWIETSSAETGSSQMISFGPSASARAIPIRCRWPARELVRIPIGEARVEADDVQQLPDARAPRAARADAVDGQRLGHDVADGHPRVERGIGVLEDDLHLAPKLSDLAARELRQLLTEEANGAARRLDQLQDAVAGRRLSRARLADEPERLALGNLEADAVDGLDLAHPPRDEDALLHREVLRQVGDDEQWPRCSCRNLRRLTGAL